MWSLEERSGHLKVILQILSSCVKDRKTRKQEISTLCMSFSKEYLFFHSFCSSLRVFQLSVRTDRERGLLTFIKHKADRCRHGDGGGLKTDKNLRTSFMDDPIVKKTLLRGIDDRAARSSPLHTSIFVTFGTSNGGIPRVNFCNAVLCMSFSVLSYHNG